MTEPLCGYCQKIVQGVCAFDPRPFTVDADGRIPQRVCHPECVGPFKVELEQQRKFAEYQMGYALRNLQKAWIKVQTLSDVGVEIALVLKWAAAAGIVGEAPKPVPRSPKLTKKVTKGKPQ